MMSIFKYSPHKRDQFLAGSLTKPAQPAPSGSERISSLPLRRWMNTLKMRSTQQMVIRQATPADQFQLAAFLGTLSAQTCRLRYLNPTTFDHASALNEARRMFERAERGFVLLACDPDDDAVVVGLVEVVRDCHAVEVAELALVIRDDRQGQGLGAQLVQRAKAYVRQMRIRTLRAHMLAENIAMRRLFEQFGRSELVAYDDGVLELAIELPPTFAQLQSAA
ncbi:GNAT family N-acetyltransferase [Candidatus Chloroploca sp. M-50]|uniref:GNAT family N-acetyltransferase n=1 Tax=Candidatus Chloroploca mongolica TaxID=2528176 RepID=A0ABS4DDW9_9CHLR|nr:GNAT family N-acetyltransferase [Candidatus Chloroploca mongolica]MBP1467646.1 GNAT family N-acetyltransferase [Candidatus Chloroploca mongolica]